MYEKWKDNRTRASARTRLVGPIVLCGCLPLANLLAAERHDANRDVPLFMARGTDDPKPGDAPRAPRSKHQMRRLSARLTRSGLAFVFVDGSAAPAGLPLPASPTLFLAGALLGVSADGRIPGAVAVDEKTVEVRIPDADSGREVILYRAVPTRRRRRIAKLLDARGFTRVRPLAGPIDAWTKAGHAIERATMSRSAATTWWCCVVTAHRAPE